MDEIEWIKTAVKVCIADQLSDAERGQCFEVLGYHYARFTEEEKAAIAKTVREQFARNDSIYIYSVFLQYMGNQDFAENVMDLMLEGEYDVYTGSMLEVQIFKYMKEFKWAYAKIRQLHRNNIEAFQRELQIDYAYIKPRNRNRKRIVLVTEQLLGDLHAPSKIVSNFAYMLKQLGYEILLFACPSDAMLPQELWFGLYRMNSLPVVKHMPLRMYYRDQEFLGYQINMDQKNMKEYHMMLSLIHAWNPIFVFDMGTINPVVDLAGRFTTLVALEMGILCPVSEGSILVRLGREEEALEREYAAALSENQTQLFMEENVPVLVDKMDRICPRSETGLPEGRFLVAVVGNRLDLDIDDAFIHVMGSILEKLPEADFVVIGIAEALKQKLTGGIYEGRVYFTGYLSQLMEVYGSLDLYVNPVRPGGGFSSMMALLAGLPVVTLPNCDVAYNVGDEFVVADLDEMVQTVVRYAQDPDFYQTKKALAHSYQEKNTDANMQTYVRKLLEGVLRLIDSQEESDAGV